MNELLQLILTRITLLWTGNMMTFDATKNRINYPIRANLTNLSVFSFISNAKPVCITLTMSKCIHRELPTRGFICYISSPSRWLHLIFYIFYYKQHKHVNFVLLVVLDWPLQTDNNSIQLYDYPKCIEIYQTLTDLKPKIFK